ncbi:virion structural protein [Cronobacter phage vB_CsaM_GAP32]|uniref:Uncharacterized protein n=1 Tax=Cronobacter phage vB_CsaM_GAP32 TaxID=1141136 RepID=K4FB43_9CAUD|nr:virion structural protein [Cronobacter phage vB_CsaM_GAP32]AFC21694.1 hypothetical protein GAP32_244 [Cronobacter phage vB_CsaM_GAP32]
MAGLGSDYIQQQLLDQSVAMNDNLSAMRTILLDIEKNTKNGSGSGGSGGGSGNPGNRDRDRRGGGNGGNPFKDAFKDLFGEVNNVSRTILGNNGSIQNTVGALSTSAGALRSTFSKLPGPIGLAANAFLGIVEVGGKVYEYLNEQLNMYNQINSAGISLADGMLTVRKGSGAAFMSINEFSAAISKNSDALAAMEGQYGDGVEHFGKLLNTVQLTQEKLGLYGVSAQQLADITAKNYKFERMYSGQQQIRNMNEAQSTTSFVQQMTYLSKTVGKSVDELISKFANMGDNLDSNTAIDALQNNFGLSESKASEVTKSMNSIFASMGAAGETLQKLNSSKLADNMLPEEFNNQFTQLYTDKLRELQAAGITDEKVLRRAMSQYVKEHEGQLQTEIQAQRRIGNVAAAQWLSQLKNIERVLNDPKNQPSPIIESFTNRFNLWIGKTFTEPFNKFYTETAEKAATYLSNLADNSTDAWDFMSKLTTDAFTKFNAGMLGPFGALANIPNRLMESIFGESWNKVADAFGNLAGDIVQIPIRLGKLIWEMFTGSESEVDAAGKELMGSIKRIFKDVIGVFTKIGSLSINFDDVKKGFTEAIESLKNKFTNLWSRIKNWWSDSSDEEPESKQSPSSPPVTPTPTASQPKTAGVQKVTAPPEYTKPEKIEQAEQTAPQEIQTAQNNSNEGMNKLLQAILNNLEAQSQNNSQAAIILRQIAENTEPPRNV